MLPGKPGIYKINIVQAIGNAGNRNGAGNKAHAIEQDGMLFGRNHLFTQVRPRGTGTRILGNSQQPANRKTNTQYQVLPDQQLVRFFMTAFQKRVFTVPIEKPVVW